MSRAGEIVGRTAVYGAGTLLRSIAAFLMLPIYARYLTPADYGIIELITIAIDLALLLLGARAVVGIYKLYSDASSDDARREVVSTAVAILAGVHVVAITLVFALNREIAAVLRAPPGFGLALSVYGISAIFNAVSEVLFAYLKIRDFAVSYVVVSLVKLVLQLVLNILFVVVLDLGYWGVIWSAVISSACVAIGLAVWLTPRVYRRPTLNCARRLLSFSTPIIAAALAMYFTVFGGRYVLQLQWGPAEVGLFAMASKFGAVLFNLVATPFSEYWSARQFDFAKQPGAAKLFGDVFFYLVLSMTLVGAGLVALTPDFLGIIASAEFHDAAKPVPWMVLAYMFQAAGDYFRFGCFQSARNGPLTFASIIALIVVWILNLLLIPEGGAQAAAQAYCGAMLVRLVIHVFVSQQLFYMDVPWRRLALVTIASAAIALVGLQVPTDTSYAFLAKGTIIALVLGGAIVIPGIEPAHRRRLFDRLWQVAGMAGGGPR